MPTSTSYKFACAVMNSVLRSGPPNAHDATKRMVRAYLDEGGPRGADAHVGDIAASLFATEDLQKAVQTFLAEGPGKATFEGR